MKINTETYDFVLVEPKMCKGHINFYKDYITRLIDNDKTILFISTEDYCDEFMDVEGLSIKSVPFKIWSCGVLSYRFFQIKFLIYLLVYIKGLSYGKLIFLSYETISLSLYSRVFRGNFSIIEHNNIDDMNRSKVKKLFYKFIGHHVEHLVFEDYIGSYLVKELNKKVGLICHPLRRVDPSSVSPFERPYIFCPSIDSSEKFLVALANFCKKNDLLLVCKNKFDLSRFNNVIQSGFFNNYEQMLYHANYIAVGVDFEYRISGVFYECVANNKKIIMNNCLFSNMMKEKYPLSVEYILGS
nr:hypothetical protein [uncultured Vibrio sp.]